MNLTTTIGNESMISSHLSTSEMFGNSSTINVTDVFQDESLLTTKAVQPQLSDLEIMMGYVLFQVAVNMNLKYPVVLFAVGVPGNVAALVTLCNMRPFTSSYVYMATLAVIDILSLNIKLVYLSMHNYRLFITDVGCRIFLFLSSFCMHFSNWILVAMTIERLIAIWFPLKVANWSTKKRSFLVLFLIGLTLGLVNIHRLIMWREQMRYDDGSTCTSEAAYMHFNTQILPYLHAIIYSFFPVAILVACNVMMIVSLKRSVKRMLSLTNKVNKEQALEKEKLQNQITVMLITVSIVFVILTLPYVIFFVVAIYWDQYVSYSQIALYHFVEQIAYILAESNHALNFYLYFLTGKKFRDCFFRIFCFFCRKMREGKKLQASHPDSAQSKQKSSNMNSDTNQTD